MKFLNMKKQRTRIRFDQVNEQRKIEQPTEKVKAIIDKITTFRGIDPTKTKIDHLLSEVSFNVMQEQFRT